MNKELHRGTGLLWIEVINSNPNGEAGGLFGYSDAYLSRMFQKYANVNFKTYLQDIRMTYAYRELLNSDKTISQIAMDNGFSSSRAFTREFQKRYGILPSEVEREK